jgi:hypothetical protein
MSDKGLFVTFVRRGIKPMAIHRKAASATKSASAGFVGIARWFTCARQGIIGRYCRVESSYRNRKCPNEKPTSLQIHSVKWTILTPYHRTGVNTRAIHTKTAKAAWSASAEFVRIGQTVYLIGGRIKCYIEIW